MGVAISQQQLEGREPKSLAIVEKHFNSIVPENLLKWESVHPRPEMYNFEPVDRFVAFGQKHGMQMVGHTFVWFAQTPEWVFEDDAGRPLGREALLERMRAHIFAVMGRYKGRIHAWDVVNEGLVDGALRPCKWLEIIGDDYIQKAYEYAREAAPDTELYYNDYNMWKPPQRDGVIRLIQDLRTKGVEIDGLGIQGHWGIDYPSIQEVASLLNACQTLGVKLMITELDLTVLPYDVDHVPERLSDLAEEERNRIDPFPGGLPAEAEAALARRYAALFSLFREHRDHIDRVTFWGVHDAQSWRNYIPVDGRCDYPLLFDRSYRPKPAFDAVVSALKGGA
jgi:endo-1,4-beta-xylanase